jgi:hypothetical protein
LILRLSPDRVFLLLIGRRAHIVLCSLNRKTDTATIRKLSLVEPMSREKFVLSSVAQAAVKKTGRSRGGSYSPVLMLKSGHSVLLNAHAKESALRIAKEIQGFLAI